MSLKTNPLKIYSWYLWHSKFEKCFQNLPWTKLLAGATRVSHKHMFLKKRNYFLSNTKINRITSKLVSYSYITFKSCSNKNLKYNKSIYVWLIFTQNLKTYLQNGITLDWHVCTNNTIWSLNVETTFCILSFFNVTNGLTYTNSRSLPEHK